MQQTKKEALKYATKLGLILGLFAIVMNLVLYITKQEKNNIFGIAYFIIPCIFILFLVRHFIKTKTDGFYTFGDAFSLSLQLCLFCFIIGAIFSLIYMQYISPNKFTEILEYQKQQLVAKGYNDEEIEMRMKSGNLVTKYPLLQALVAIIFCTVLSAISSLIIAAITKKEKQDAIAG